MSADQPRFQSPSDLTPQLADTLLQWGLSLADSKHKLGLRLSEWSNAGPSLEASVGACALTQEELGHARSLFAMLRDLPGAAPELGSEADLKRSDCRNPRLLDKPWGSWLEVIAFNVLLDRALSLAVEALRHSQYAPLRQRAAKILQEEEHHRIFGDAWLKSLADLGEETRQRLQLPIQKSWVAGLALLGPDEDEVTARLVEAGILDRRSSELRDRFESQARSVLNGQSLAAPHISLDWSRWDSRRREFTT